MNKEIRDYQESMFMGLDLRQCVCSVLAILTAIGIYFGMRDITGQEITGSEPSVCVLAQMEERGTSGCREFRPCRPMCMGKYPGRGIQGS